MRSAIAVIVGFTVWSALWLGLNQLFAALFPNAFDANGMTSSAGILLGALAGSIVISVVSGLVTAKIVDGRPRTQAWILGVLLLAVGLGVQISVWSSMPLWYHLPFLALLIPATLAGARIGSPPGPATA